MKIQIFKDKNGNIVNWTTGNVNCSVKITNKKTGDEYESIKEKNNLDEIEGKKLQTSDYDPIIKNGQLKAVKNISAIAKETEEMEKKNLKEKFKTGNFTNEDIKKLADLML